MNHVLTYNTRASRIFKNDWNATMAELEKRKLGGGGKLTRSETVTVRLDPKLRYLADLAARKQRRTLSSYIEWAIEDSLNRMNLYSNSDMSLAEESAELWDVDEADRFAKLALRHPDLLTHEEQVRWKLVRENGSIWRGRYAGNDKKWTWDIEESNLLFERLRDHWVAFCAAAENGTGQEGLPKWTRNAPAGSSSPPSTRLQKSGFEDMDDDIPF